MAVLFSARNVPIPPSRLLGLMTPSMTRRRKKEAVSELDSPAPPPRSEAVVFPTTTSGVTVPGHFVWPCDGPSRVRARAAAPWVLCPLERGTRSDRGGDLGVWLSRGRVADPYPEAALVAVPKVKFSVSGGPLVPVGVAPVRGCVVAVVAELERVNLLVAGVVNLLVMELVHVKLPDEPAVTVSSQAAPNPPTVEVPEMETMNMSVLGARVPHSVVQDYEVGVAEKEGESREGCYTPLCPH